MASNSTVFNSLASGTVQAGGTNPANVGLVELVQYATVNFGADGSTTTIATLPAGSQIFSIDIDVTTAFNAGSTNTLKIGTASSATQFVSATAVGSAGRESVATTGNYANWQNVGTTSDTTVIATYNQTGTAASAGSARVAIRYAF
jgi:hypothetical protein